MSEIVKITKISGTAVPIHGNDIDTDRIIPARYLKEVTFARMGEYPFFDERFDASGKKKDHPFNDSEYKGASLLFVNKNFGCGSSREGAAYAVLDFGVRALIGPSFGDVFVGNCLQNGIVPAVLPIAAVRDLWRQLKEHPGTQITVDLVKQAVIAPDGTRHEFAIDATRKERLLKGLDDVGVTLEHLPQIEAFEASYRQRMPWRASRI